MPLLAYTAFFLILLALWYTIILADTSNFLTFRQGRGLGSCAGRRATCCHLDLRGSVHLGWREGIAQGAGEPIAAIGLSENDNVSERTADIASVIFFVVARAQYDLDFRLI